MAHPHVQHERWTRYHALLAHPLFDVRGRACQTTTIMSTKIMTRPVQRGIARAVIALLLLGQMMVAAYACPRVGADEGVPAEATPYAASADVANQAAEMPAGCDGTMVDTPNLCAAHCQASDQNVDATQTSAAPAHVLSSFYVVHIPSARGELDQNSTPTEAINAIPPPHAILHCCFRI